MVVECMRHGDPGLARLWATGYRCSTVAEVPGVTEVGQLVRPREGGRVLGILSLFDCAIGPSVRLDGRDLLYGRPERGGAYCKPRVSGTGDFQPDYVGRVNIALVDMTDRRRHVLAKDRGWSVSCPRDRRRVVTEVPAKRELFDPWRWREVGLISRRLPCPHHTVATGIHRKDGRRKLNPDVYEGERSRLLHVPDPSKHGLDVSLDGSQLVLYLQRIFYLDRALKQAQQRLLSGSKAGQPRLRVDIIFCDVQAAGQLRHHLDAHFPDTKDRLVERLCRHAHGHNSIVL